MNGRKQSSREFKQPLSNRYTTEKLTAERSKITAYDQLNQKQETAGIAPPRNADFRSVLARCGSLFLGDDLTNLRAAASLSAAKGSTCAHEKEYTRLKPVPSKRVGRGPGGEERSSRPLSQEVLMAHQVFLDHFQTEQFGLYWRHYPEIGIDAGIFCNLLLYGNIGLESDSFFPDETRRYIWSDAFDRFLALGKLEFVDEPDSSERMSAFFFRTNTEELNLPDMVDVFNYEYCVRQKVPFCISKRRAQDIQRIIIIANETFGISSPSEDAIEADKTKTNLAEWLFDIEVPALSVRNQMMRRQFLVNHSYIPEDNWFISPEELVQIFSDINAINTIRSKIILLAERIATRSELADSIKMEYEELNQRVSISDWVFTSIGLALDWVPLPGTGTAATLAEKGINHLVQKKFGWLLFMNKLNRRLREDKINGKDDTLN